MRQGSDYQGGNVGPRAGLQQQRSFSSIIGPSIGGRKLGRGRGKWSAGRDVYSQKKKREARTSTISGVVFDDDPAEAKQVTNRQRKYIKRAWGSRHSHERGRSEGKSRWPPEEMGS